MNINVLSRQKQVFNFREDRHLREHDVVAVFQETVVGAFLVAVLVADGERR